MDSGDLYRIIEFYQNKKVISNDSIKHLNSNSEEMVFSHLERAIGNAVEVVDNHFASATPSRFSIWSADIIWLIQEVQKAVQTVDKTRAQELLSIIDRNMRAFSDCCRLIDSQNGYMQFESEENILAEFNDINT